MKSGFLDKLIDRLDKLDPESLQTHFLRLARERGLLEMIFQSIQEGVIVLDGRGFMTYANKAAEHLLGFTLESTRGRPVSRFLRELDWDRILNLDESEWSKLITREIEITYPEHRFLTFYVVPLPPDEGRERGAVVILRDITHDRLNEATLLESERMNAVKLLAAGVAHEIGNPLNALTIHLQLLEREIHDLPAAPGRELEELVEVARNEVSRLDMIITQFLRAIRPASPELARSRVEDTLQETLSLVKQEIQNRSIDVRVAIDGPIPSIEMDADQIKQAFFNLLKNALQAMPDGGLLTISVTADNEHVSVVFRDTGKGIAPEEFGRIFEPYHTTKEEGSGLGLMIVQRIVQDHGGQIEVASKPDQGTSFTIMLPLTDRRVRLLQSRQAEQVPPPDVPPAGAT